MINKTLKIFGQSITGILILVLGISWIYFTIPGQRSFCDSDQVYMSYFRISFIFITIGFLINSIIFLIKKQWTTYRIIAISLTLFIGLLILSTRGIMTKTLYGKTMYTITNQDNAYTLIKLRLFDDYKFISVTYNLSCNVENIGTYKLTDNELTLTFEGEKSEYLETRYRLKNDTLKSLDNKNEILVINKS